MKIGLKELSLAGVIFATLFLVGRPIIGQEVSRDPQPASSEENIQEAPEPKSPPIEKGPEAEPDTIKDTKEEAPETRAEVDKEEPKAPPAAEPPTGEPAPEKSGPDEKEQIEPEAGKAPVEPAPRPQQQSPEPQVKAPAPSPPVRRPPPAVLFGTTSTAKANLALFPHWTGALQRYYRRRGQVAGDCQASRFNSCHMQRWSAHIQEVRGESRERQLNLVNRYMNTHRYIVDPINYGVAEYWAVPNEFLRKFGDCEDYAIAKYLSLRALGWKAEDLRIVVLQDLNLGVLHAILVVDYNGKNLVLDNQITLVIDASKVHHYKPVYSLNENGWWRHTPAPRAAG